jgi:hypothetical protein
MAVDRTDEAHAAGQKALGLCAERQVYDFASSFGGEEYR